MSVDATGRDTVPATRSGRTFSDRRRVEVHAPAAMVDSAITSLGGRNGWYYGDWLWTIRGIIDKCLGGVGMRRDHGNPDPIEPGAVLDCWRIEDYKEASHLILRAEMNVWGDAWLEYRIDSTPDSTCVLTQTARYHPAGWFGHLYWIAVYPVHVVIFRGMARAIGRRAESAWLQQEPYRTA